MFWVVGLNVLGGTYCFGKDLSGCDIRCVRLEAAPCRMISV